MEVNMILCPKCNAVITLPRCHKCKHQVANNNDIWQLTDMPDFAIDGDQGKYIGY
jgi:predicted RNA-binding protein with PUA domain